MTHYDLRNYFHPLNLQELQRNFKRKSWIFIKKKREKGDVQPKTLLPYSPTHLTQAIQGLFLTFLGLFLLHPVHDSGYNLTGSIEIMNDK
jgi:hypothetical protein